MEVIDAFPVPGFREPVNCFTHLIAVFVFSILGFRLIRKGRGDWIRTTSLSVMVFSSLFLLSMSVVYHLLGAGAARVVMRQLDIAGVFLLIAGTMTPLHAILDTGFTRWALLLLVWSAAATGITLTAIFSESLRSGGGIAIFLLFGWGGVISFIRLFRRYGLSFVKPLLWGGMAYTLGAIGLGLNWPILIPRVIGAHEVWHVWVLIGLSLHWKFVFQFANGPPDASSSDSRLLLFDGVGGKNSGPTMRPRDHEYVAR